MNTTFPRMHVSLYVSNLSASVDFYTTFFGEQPTKIKPGYAKYILEHPSLIISFVESKTRVNQGFGHLGFQVETPAELQEKLSEARKNNLIVREELEIVCCYANQDKFWVTDPDGVEWEVYYFRNDAQISNFQSEKQAMACCPL
jgi:catechol 2,3-dioxygenase-like lactoylglutathione lyase family enzyme